MAKQDKYQIGQTLWSTVGGILSRVRVVRVTDRSVVVAYEDSRVSRLFNDSVLHIQRLDALKAVLTSIDKRITELAQNRVSTITHFLSTATPEEKEMFYDSIHDGATE